MSRKINQNGLALIKYFEGLRLKAYPDPATGGVPYTIGYGHTGKDVKIGLSITEQKAVELLMTDLAKFEELVSSAVPNNTTDNQFAALVSFAFNAGWGNLKKSTLLKLLNDANVLGATDEFLKWNKANGKVMPGLTKRRKAEQGLFATPDDQEWSVS